MQQWSGNPDTNVENGSKGAIITSPLTILQQAGIALYGAKWQRPLATFLEIDDRAVRRWVADECDVPDWVLPRLADRLDALANVVEDYIDNHVSTKVR